MLFPVWPRQLGVVFPGWPCQQYWGLATDVNAETTSMLYDCVVSKTLGLLSTVATDDDESTDAVVSPLATGRTWLKRWSGYGSSLAKEACPSLSSR